MAQTLGQSDQFATDLDAALHHGQMNGHGRNPEPTVQDITSHIRREVNAYMHQVAEERLDALVAKHLEIMIAKHVDKDIRRLRDEVAANAMHHAAVESSRLFDAAELRMQVMGRPEVSHLVYALTHSAANAHACHRLMFHGKASDHDLHLITTWDGTMTTASVVFSATELRDDKRGKKHHRSEEKTLIRGEPAEGDVLALERLYEKSKSAMADAERRVAESGGVECVMKFQ